MSSIADIDSKDIALKIQHIPAQPEVGTRYFLVAMEWDNGSTTKGIVTASSVNMAVALHSTNVFNLVPQGAAPTAVRVFDYLGEIR